LVSQYVCTGIGYC